jgi:hypothetical protein
VTVYFKRWPSRNSAMIAVVRNDVVIWVEI